MRNPAIKGEAIKKNENRYIYQQKRKVMGIRTKSEKTDIYREIDR
jgi:hypothetical protein